jgi:pantetheine-phosphate adenylyltransferase
MTDVLKEHKHHVYMNSKLRSVCLKYMNHDDYFMVRHMYDDKSRHYHNWNHVLKVASFIWNNVEDGELRDMLLLTALLHDAVYDTKSKTNESDSAKLVELLNIDEPTKIAISELIMFTTYQRPAVSVFEQIFAKADLGIFSASHYAQIEFEKQVFQEYYWVPIPMYVEKRVEILKELQVKYGCDTEFLVKYLQTKIWKVGFYPGTFYPFHIGHKSVLDQAVKMFDKVIIGFGNTDDKTSFKWNTDEYGELNAWVKSNYESVELKSLITENIAAINSYADSVTLIRGLRNSTDLIYEQNYLQALRDMYPKVNAAYFMTEPNLAHVSSSLIRGILKLSPRDALKYYKI